MHPDRVFTSLHHLIDGEWMREAYRLTRKDGATGIDGVTAADYERDLEANLESLLGRIKSGSYRAPPVRRHYIPKADGTRRPLGIPTFEDKVAQRAILMLLEPIYEGDFCFHQGLDAIRYALSGFPQLPDGPGGSVPLGDVTGRRMVHQSLGQGVRQHQLAFGNRDEAVTHPVEPELRTPGLADAAVEIGQLHEIPRAAGGGGKHPAALQMAALGPSAIKYV